mmetsp:Transcript_143318/g.458008  ORF Transcript_143318/g.458008 Transcript_143318/m.458008 type:complete len:469 (+) Transcript_143318:2623-4029(+)
MPARLREHQPGSHECGHREGRLPLPALPQVPRAHALARQRRRAQAGQLGGEVQGFPHPRRARGLLRLQRLLPWHLSCGRRTTGGRESRLRRLHQRLVGRLSGDAGDAGVGVGRVLLLRRARGDAMRTLPDMVGEGQRDGDLSMQERGRAARSGPRPGRRRLWKPLASRRPGRADSCRHRVPDRIRVEHQGEEGVLGTCQGEPRRVAAPHRGPWRRTPVLCRRLLGLLGAPRPQGAASILRRRGRAPGVRDGLQHWARRQRALPARSGPRPWAAHLPFSFSRRCLSNEWAGHPRQEQILDRCWPGGGARFGSVLHQGCADDADDEIRIHRLPDLGERTGLVASVVLLGRALQQLVSHGRARAQKGRSWNICSARQVGAVVAGVSDRAGRRCSAEDVSSGQTSGLWNRLLGAHRGVPSRWWHTSGGGPLLAHPRYAWVRVRGRSGLEGAGPSPDGNLDTGGLRALFDRRT